MQEQKCQEEDNIIVKHKNKIVKKELSQKHLCDKGRSFGFKHLLIYNCCLRHSYAHKSNREGIRTFTIPLKDETFRDGNIKKYHRS